MAASTNAAKPSFGELLAAHRAAAGLTQEELAGRAGLSVDAVSLLERGARSSPRPRTVRLLADALALSPREHEAFVAAGGRRRPAAPLRVAPELRLPSTPNR
jgi:transcriptional regulator with XRE-family HTH domain